MYRPDRTTAVALVALLAVVGCVRRPAPAPPGPDPLTLPSAYVAQADGELELNDLRLPGRLRVAYLVNPDGSVLVSDLTAWIRDVDIVTHFLFIETDRQRLRCTKLSNSAVIAGRLGADGKIIFPAGAADLTGVSFAARDADRVCRGEARQVNATSNAEVVAIHDPARNRFSMSGSFRGRHGGDDLDIRFAMSGDFVNRPPRALLGVFEPSGSGGGGGTSELELPQGGCPPLHGINPPGAVANDPAGLRLRLISLSDDPDGSGSGPRAGRGDIARDVWSHSVDGGPFVALGTTQVTGPVLFELHRDHVLALTTSDHARAASRMVCRFRVLTAEEAGTGGDS